MDFKTCTLCQKSLPVDHFYENKTNGLESRCKACKKATRSRLNSQERALKQTAEKEISDPLTPIYRKTLATRALEKLEEVNRERAEEAAKEAAVQAAVHEEPGVEELNPALEELWGKQPDNFEEDLPELPVQDSEQPPVQGSSISLRDFQRTKGELGDYTKAAGERRPTETRPPIEGKSSNWTAESRTWNEKPTAAEPKKTITPEVNREEIERQRPKTERPKRQFCTEDEKILETLMWRVACLGYVFYIDNFGAVLRTGLKYRWAGDLSATIYEEVAGSEGQKRVSDCLPLETVRDLIRRAKLPPTTPTQTELERLPPPNLGGHYDDRLTEQLSPFSTVPAPRPRPEPVFDPFKELRKRAGYNE